MSRPKEYEDRVAHSYSAVKDFISLGRYYYRNRYVLKDPNSKKKVTDAMRLGSANDLFILTREKFDSEFVVAPKLSVTGKTEVMVKKFVELLHNNDRGTNVLTLVEDAYNFAEMKRPGLAKVLDAFNTRDSDIAIAIRTLQETAGKQLISDFEYTAIEKNDRLVRQSHATADYFTGDYRTQVPVYLKYGGYELKALFDIIKIDHDNKVIRPADLKTVDNVEEFDLKWLKDFYYVQQFIYTLAAEVYRDENFPDYEIDHFKFIVCHSNCLQDPLLWSIDLHEANQGSLEFGFRTSGGKHYPGVMSAINDIEWHKKNDFWGMSKSNYDAGGKVNRLF